MFLSPDYGARSLADVLPAVSRAIGVEAGLGDPAWQLPPAASYVVLLVDGMGHDLIEAHRDHAPYLHALLTRAEDVGTAGVPTTTATSLTSLGTGLPPGGHGMVGYTSRVPATGHLLNALQWDSAVDPRDWQPHPTAFERLSRAGALTSVVSRRDYRDSGLTRSAQRGADYVGADRAGERIAATVSAAGRAPSVTYVYDADLDWTGHRFGVDSPQWREQLITVDGFCEHLRESLAPATRLLITADHGMVDSPLPERIDVDLIPGLRDGVVLLGGEARFRHVYVADGALGDVLAIWRSVLGDRAVVLGREEAVAAGWFGPVEDRVLPRIGDLVVATEGRHALMSSRDFPREMKLVGMHGSLTPVEMRIPLLVD